MSTKSHAAKRVNGAEDKPPDAKSLEGNPLSVQRAGEHHVDVQPKHPLKEQVVAGLIKQLMKERWGRTDLEMAVAAKMSLSGLNVLKTSGAKKPTANLRKVCKLLNVDPIKLCEGQIVEAAKEFDVDVFRTKHHAASEGRDDLHGLLDMLIGTSEEVTIERVLRALVEYRVR